MVGSKRCSEDRADGSRQGLRRLPAIDHMKDQCGSRHMASFKRGILMKTYDTTEEATILVF